MATVEIFAAATPFDEPSPSTDLLNDIVLASSTTVVIKNRDADTLVYDGTVTVWTADLSDQFVIDPDLGIPVEGTIATVEHFSDTSLTTLLAQVTGLSVPVDNAAVALVSLENVERYYEVLLSGDDTFTSLDGDSSDLAAQGGNDTITGTAFNDVLDGGLGNDTLDGGDGNDELRSGGMDLVQSAADVLNGGDGDDLLIAEGAH